MHSPLKLQLSPSSHSTHPFIVAAAFNLSAWFVDRRFTITIAALVFINPWLWMRKIGVLSYIRSPPA